MKRLAYILLFLLGITALAMPPQDDNTRTGRPAQQRRAQREGGTGPATGGAGQGRTQQTASGAAANDSAKVKQQPKAQPKSLTLADETIPDSLLHARWRIQPTAPILYHDLDSSALDLRMPENIKQEAVYNDSLNLYFIGSLIGSKYLNAPIVMTPEEYMMWSEKRARSQYFRQKDAENVKTKGENKFSFTDMQFDLGPAEKIFGPGGVRVKTQGTAELKVGATLKSIDNPSLPINNRKTTSFDFDEKINLSVNGKVGDKVNMNLNYNTDATFDFDTKNLKLKYDGKEDEMIKLVEAGNVTFPSNNSLVHGSSSLFGIRTDWQFGKLKLQTVLSQKKSTSKSVSSKGGTQTTPFEINAADYEENRHFFLSHFFREQYDRAMSNLPNITTGIQINRIEVWVTNKSGTTSNSRNIIAFADLGENRKIKNTRWWSPTGMNVPSNLANDEYSTLVANIDTAARSMEAVTAELETMENFVGGEDYEKLSSARLLSSTEYTVSNGLGYITLKTGLQTDQVLAVAFEYTYGGRTYQVGEFSTDVTQTNQCLFVKALKNTSNNPLQANWDLMMKNVYYLASNIESTNFRMDIKYQSDTTGTYLTYLPEEALKSTTLLKAMGLDRLDANMKPHANGQFDFVSGYTVANGRIFLPSAEPFGEYLRKFLQEKGMGDVADKYCFDELYDSTKTVAKQIAEKDKYLFTGQYKGTSANVISMGAYNVPRGSVKVTAGGVELTEGSDYSVDYSAGEVTILNQSILDAGTNVQVSLEDNTNYGMQRKTMLGLNWEYDFNKNFQLGGTFMHLSEQAMTTKVTMGEEPLNNTIWGLNLNWKQESQWLTNVLDKLPLLHCTVPSSLTLTGEFAQLIAGKASGTQDNASYLDDFESAKDLYDISDPKAWVLSSVPPMFPDYNDKSSLASGYDRARLAWYNVDPIFTRRSSSLTPAHIKSDLEQLSNHYVREVYVRELYPNRDQSTYNGATSTLPVLNLAYYPKERGPYNLTTRLNADGTLQDPASKWGGMMRKLETTDFEQANIEYVEFWMLDPYIYTRKEGTASRHSGELYINLGEVSEDVLRDGKKFYESGMPVDGTAAYETTQWGRIPKQATQTYAFATSAGSRERQDVGLNGLTDAEEQTFSSYSDWLSQASAIVTNDSVMESWREDPAGDNYHYYRGSDYDAEKRSIMDRYKYINNPQGNSPSSDNQTESYDTSYKTGPDVEDINQDYTLNEYERFYQYRIPISDEELQAYNRGQKSDKSYIVDHRDYNAKLRNGDSITVRWYQYRIPLANYDSKHGSINDFTSIRFMRMFLTGFEEDIVLRFGSLDLVRGTWRQYKQSLQTGASAESGTLEMSAVNVEENTERQPVAYVMPPGITRVSDPNQPQLTEENEQALCLIVKNLSQNESKAVYKNTNLNLRQYNHLQMFVHANHLVPNSTQLEDNQLAVFIRLGSDYKGNYYEYLIPLKLTPEGHYRWNMPTDRTLVWPEENMIDIDLNIFTELKKRRNMARADGSASYTTLYTDYDPNKPNNRIAIMGNPSLGEVKTMIIGVRNLSNTLKSGEVWVNELRLQDPVIDGGWAASGAMALKLSDIGTLNVSGKYMTDGFGGLEETVLQRSTETQKSYAITTNVNLGKFFPEKAKVNIPLYYSYTKEIVSPKYNPLDTDMELDEALESTATKNERDSIESIAVTKRINSNFSLTDMRVDIKNKKFPLPIDPANFSFTYAHSHSHNSGETTVYNNHDDWKGSINYSYSPVYKTWEPFNKSNKKKGTTQRTQNTQRNQQNQRQTKSGAGSKWSQFAQAFGINYLPQSLAINSEWHRSYTELQERDLQNTENPSLPLTFSEQFLWNRELSLRWDLTKNLHMNFSSATRAEIEEPYTPVNKDLYPDAYEAWKDSVWSSLKHWGTPLDYNQNFSASYQPPLDKIPLFDWIKADAKFTSRYSWQRGTELDDGTSLGNTIANNRTVDINGTVNLETLYNHIPFLKKTNERFKKQPQKDQKKKNTQKTPKTQKDSKAQGTEAKDDLKGKAKEAKELPKNKNTFQKEITLMPDSTVEIQHGKKSKRLLISAKNKDGKQVKLKWKTVDENKIKVWLPKESAKKEKTKKEKARKAKKRKDDTALPDSLLAAADSLNVAADSLGTNKEDGMTKKDDTADLAAADTAAAPQPVELKLSVTPKEPLENKKWYNVAQHAARFLMMVRNVNISYRNQRNMTLPGFMPNVGDMFGQRTGGVMAPGLGFAFGLTGDSFIDKAQNNGWLLGTDSNDSLSTRTTSAATTSATEDLQIRATLEPIRDLKIDLSATRTTNQSRTVQFMYEGSPTTYGGSLTMTTISLHSALEGMGDANDGYHSAVFERFCANVESYREKVQAQYPTPEQARANGNAIVNANQVDPYSADVLIPAFLNSYTLGAGSSLDIFPALTRLLPNWTIKYSGLAKLPWVRDHFKSVNINHAYKSIYAVGNYASYSSWVAFNGDLGYVQAADGSYTPSSRYNISTVSITESFSPLLGIDVTFNNNLTAKLEYKTTRGLNLSMTSVQINEALSKDWVIGLGYKISNFNIFGSGTSRQVKGSKKKGAKETQETQKSQNSSSRKNEINHDLNTRLDISFRNQAAITRDIRTGVSSASSGNSALKISLRADYTLSRFLTLTAYYERQTNTPLLSSSSYPTTTQDFGFSLKFSLTR